MNAQKLSEAVKLSVEAALKSGQTDVAQAAGILHAHANALAAMLVRPNPQPPVRKLEIIDRNGNEGQ